MRNIVIVLLFAFQTAFAQDATEGIITDIDGNDYNIKKNGTQWWMQDNLKTTHYSDGTTIAEIKDSLRWVNTDQSHIAAWCYYDNNKGNNPTYGKLYNWYAVADPHHLCPTGWHVPSDSEFNTLTDYLGGANVVGGKMKAAILWNAPNTGADNSSGFTALPAGTRTADGAFVNLSYHGVFWSSTENSIGFAWYRCLYYDNSFVNRNFYYKEHGLSVRCVAD